MYGSTNYSGNPTDVGDGQLKADLRRLYKSFSEGDISFEDAASLVDESVGAFTQALKGDVWKEVSFADGKRRMYIEMELVSDVAKNPNRCAIQQYLANKAEEGDEVAIELVNQLIDNHRASVVNYIAREYGLKAEELYNAKKKAA